MKIRPSEIDHQWDVVDMRGAVVATFPTNAEAWRFLDRHGDAESERSNRIRRAFAGDEFRP